MDPSRTPQGYVFYDTIFYCKLRRLCLCLRLVLIFVDQIHQGAVDCFEFCVVLNGLEEFFTVFFYGFENADLKVLCLVVAGTCRNERQIPAAFMLQFC